MLFPTEAVETIFDEQYVRNVVDVLFRIRNPAGRLREPEKNVALPT